jgi:hypothetical protein
MPISGLPQIMISAIAARLSDRRIGMELPGQSADHRLAGQTDSMVVTRLNAGFGLLLCQSKRKGGPKRPAQSYLI